MNKIEQKITDIWLKKLSEGGVLEVSDLKQFSGINLKKKRNLKKFLKAYYRYVSDEVANAYRTILISQSLSGVMRQMLSFNLDPVESMEGGPKVELCYLDYKYKDDENRKG